MTESGVLTAIRSFLRLPGVLGVGFEVVRGQVNRVAEPQTDDFVVMTPIRRTRLATNVNSYDTALPDPDNVSHLSAMQLDVQLDVHGPAAADNAQRIITLWRDDFACRALGTDIQPLHADDAQQMPFVNGEQQYEYRHVVVLALQANFIVSTTQDFASSLALEIIEVETAFPIGAP